MDKERTRRALFESLRANKPGNRSLYIVAPQKRAIGTYNRSLQKLFPFYFYPSTSSGQAFLIALSVSGT